MEAKIGRYIVIDLRNRREPFGSFNDFEVAAFTHSMLLDGNAEVYDTSSGSLVLVMKSDKGGGLTSYIVKAMLLRDELREMTSQARTNETEVSDNFYPTQEKLLKTVRNAHSYCRRYGIEYPMEII